MTRAAAPPEQPAPRRALLRASLARARDAASHPIGQAALVFAATAALRRTVLRDVSSDDMAVLTRLAVGVTFASVAWSGVRDVSDAVRCVGEGVRSVGEGVRSVGEGVRSVGEGVQTLGEGVHAVARSLDGVGAGARDAGAWCATSHGVRVLRARTG
jgi:hypothetical protein